MRRYTTFLQAVGSSSEDVRHAATRIEHLAYEWAVWDSGDGIEAEGQEAALSTHDVSEVGLATQPLGDLTAPDGPQEVALSPPLTPTSSHLALMSAWWHPSPQQAMPGGMGLPQLAAGCRAMGVDSHGTPP